MPEVIRQFHTALGHAGVMKVDREIRRRFAFPPALKLRDEVREDRRRCLICQACDHLHTSGDAPIEHTPVPAYVMSSVAVDIFSLPSVEWDGRNFDAMVVCVDRLSGWILARPCSKAGLTAEKAAHLLLEGGWEVFGIPAVITSDQGPQFKGQWWRTMCARLGIRMAYSQAYRAQANGRAEVAGKSLISALRRIHAEEGISWMEALPRALWKYHATPGEAGLSPFQILFGRDRYEAGAPLDEEHECQGAKDFFDRVAAIDAKVAEALNKAHAEQQRRINAKRKTKTPFQQGDLVWVLRARNSPQTDKLDTWWIGPCKVTERLGEQSYTVMVKPNRTMEVHGSHMKEYVEDVMRGKPVELYHYLPTYKSTEVAPDEWEVDKILRHRTEKDGTLKFLTRWENAEEGEETWEPVETFIQKYCYEFVQYCQKKGIPIDITACLKGEPSEE